jgi:hypothetical protein
VLFVVCIFDESLNSNNNTVGQRHSIQFMSHSGDQRDFRGGGGGGGRGGRIDVNRSFCPGGNAPQQGRNEHSSGSRQHHSTNERITQGRHGYYGPSGHGYDQHGGQAAGSAYHGDRGRGRFACFVV